MTRFTTLFAVLLLGITPSCQQQPAQKLSLKAVDRSPLPAEAQLTLMTPPDSLRLGENSLQFQVVDYSLGIATENPRAQEIANSAKGQHIHLILNNEPYMAKYQKDFALKLDTGNHVLLAFLSRSYHESLKASRAFVVQQFHLGTSAAQPYDLENGKHLFFSRPKGSYTLQKGSSGSILLDFYLLNTDLTDGSYVEAVIDDISFKITEWKPYYIQGLSAGEHTISIQLMNRNHLPIEGPFNSSGIRRFNIKNNTK